MSAGPLDYVTYKYVVLKDRRLGVAYYILAISIVLFIITEVFYRKGYLQFDTNPQGVVRAVLSEELSDYNKSSQRNYCISDPKIPCKYEDPLELNWPVEGRAVTVTTFAKDKYQRSPSYTNPESDEYEIFQELQYYTFDPELVIIKVDHAVVASLFTDNKGTEKLAASKRIMKGFLVNQSGMVVRELSLLGKPDKITLQELLETAGIQSLDTSSSAYNAKGQNIRQRGAVLRVTINYQNWYDTWIGTSILAGLWLYHFKVFYIIFCYISFCSDIKYFYRVRYIPYMDYNTKQIIPYYNNTNNNVDIDKETKWRIMRKRYAVRVEFEQHGSLGIFSLSTLLLKLASGMGLLTLAATIIDVFALYLLPNRNKYRSRLYEPSEEIHTKKKN